MRRGARRTGIRVHSVWCDMIFSTGVTRYKCVSCSHEITRATSTSVLYYLALLGIGVAVIVPFYERAFGPALWERMVPIVIVLATLIASALVWSVASSPFRESVKTCSRCAGQIEIVGGGFSHGIVPNLDDVVIGLLFGGLQVAVVFVIQAVGNHAVWHGEIRLRSR